MSSRSRERPEPPPEPDINELIQNDVARIKRLLGLDVNRLALGSEVEGIIINGPFGDQDFTVTGVNLIEFVNVSATMASSQTNAPSPPAQITGLTVTPQGGSDTQLNLAWTANTAPDFNYYIVYRGPTGFTAGPSFKIAQPATNSYSSTGLNAGTAYYYRVSAMNDALMEGLPSSEVGGTTTGTAPSTPAQVTGLNVTVAGDNQLDLTWTASSDPGLSNYNIYRSITTGTETLLTSSVTNSYSDITVASGTTYYYKVAAVNSIGVGTLSTEDSATTTLSSNLWLKFDGDYTDSSSNALVMYGTPPYGAYTPNGFQSPGKFGTNAWRVDTPVHFPGGFADYIYFNLPTPTPVQLNLTTGFSYSFWIYPTNISALALRRALVETRTDSSNQFTIQLDSSGILYFFVMKAGTIYKRQVTGITINNWHHISAVFDGGANTVKLYRNAVEGASSAATPEWPTVDNWYCGARSGTAGACYTGYIDELQYFKGSVLTATQVTNLMNTNAT